MERRIRGRRIGYRASSSSGSSSSSVVCTWRDGSGVVVVGVLCLTLSLGLSM